MCSSDLENGRKWPKTRVLPIPLESCTGGHRASKSSSDSKIMGYNPQKRLEIAENTSFSDLSRVVYRGSQGIEILPRIENHGVITHENDQKWPKTRVLPIPLESCTGGHRASKSSRASKIMGYNPRKRLEMAENTSFTDARSEERRVGKECRL